MKLVKTTKRIIETMESAGENLQSILERASSIQQRLDRLRMAADETDKDLLRKFKISVDFTSIRVCVQELYEIVRAAGKKSEFVMKLSWAFHDKKEADKLLLRLADQEKAIDQTHLELLT